MDRVTITRKDNGNSFDGQVKKYGFIEYYGSTWAVVVVFLSDGSICAFNEKECNIVVHND